MMDMDGSNVQQITSNSTNNYADMPSISQSNGIITYRANIWNGTKMTSNLSSINHLGQNNNIIYTPPDQSSVSESSISKDGEKIYFTLTSSGNYDIYSVNINGTNLQNLTNTPSSYEENPKVSPDGSKVLYTSSKEGKPSIYTMNSDGSNHIRLTSLEYQDANASWSPDGTKIVYVSRRNDNRDIYTMSSNGWNENRITYHSSNDTMPSWSTSNDKVIWHSVRDESTWGELYIMDSNGNSKSRLTNNNSTEEGASFD